jgi:ubiquinone/menaquinone biosynthesis C-methylase UbiE
MPTQDAPTSQKLETEDWAGDMGRKWLANLAGFEAMIAPIGNALLAQADYQAGEQVIDVGCGGGATTLAIAQTVAPVGGATGVDISPDLVRAAQTRATQAGIENVEFICADATDYHWQGQPADRLFSRFGSMFFEDPFAAFTNLHGVLRPGGRIDLAVWGPPRDNLWMMEIMGVARNHVEIPTAIPRTPGPFAFEDLDYLNEILSGAGFTDINIATYQELQPLGGPGATPQEAVEFAMAATAVGRLLAEAGDEVLKQAAQEMTELFSQHYVADQGVMMKCKVWLVSAIA